MTAPVDLYPLATQEGTSIPLDVIKPKGVISKTFLMSTGSTAVTLPVGTSLILVRASVNCYIDFTGTAQIPADGIYTADMMFLEAGTTYTVAPPTTSVSAVGIAEGGSLVIQVLETWAAIAQPVRLNKV